MSGTSDTTKWPQYLHFHFVLVVFVISRCIAFLTFSPVWSWMSSPAPSPLVSRWLFYTSRQRSPLFSLSLFVCMELLFIFMLLSVYWFLSVFECHYTCSHQGYRSWDAFCFITFLNWFHSAQAHAFSRLIALLDSCKETLLRHVKIYNCALCRLCAF